MKVLYGLEADFCINNPELIADSFKDIVLPKYFYTQLAHLSNGNFPTATDAAIKIMNSFMRQRESDVLIFKTISGGTVYFTNEEANCVNIDTSYENLEPRNLLDRYLLSLLKLSETLKAKIVFLASSPEVIRKCRTLHFEIATIEEFSAGGKSWLQPEMLLDIQAETSNAIRKQEFVSTQEQATAPEPDSAAQVQWRDIKVAGQSNIHWIDITRRN